MGFEEEIEEKGSELDTLLVELIKSQKRNFKSVVRMFIVTVVAFTVLLASMVVGYFWYESQYEYTERTEIRQEVDGAESRINNVNGNMYNDNATHNEGK